MSTFTEQFSAVRQSQVEAQINFFKEFSSKAVDTTGKLIALNLAATRAQVEQSTAAIGQLLTVKDPRDLFALTTQTQSSFDSLLAYGRALAGIAAAAPLAFAPAAAAAAPAAKAPEQPVLDAPAQFTPEIAPEVKADPLPAAAAKPIAKATSKAVKAAPAKPAAAPVAAAAKPIVVNSLKAVEAAPPPAPVSGTPVVEYKPQQQQDLLAAKPKKKK